MATIDELDIKPTLTSSWPLTNLEIGIQVGLKL